MSAGLIVVLLVLLAAAGTAAAAYNGLVAARNRCDEAWSGIQAQLQRRHDVVPNLVETVTAYAAHERGTLEAIVGARNRAIAAAGTTEQAPAEAALSAELPRLTAVAEQYPQLRSTENFGRLQAELSQLEDEIQAARRIYNNNVQRYMTRKDQLPGSLVAGLGSFPNKAMFFLEDPDDAEPPEVRFT